MTDDIFKFLVLKVIVLGSAEPFFMPFYDTLQPIYPTLSQSHFLVATTSTRIWLIIWNQPKIPVPLHQLFESYVCSFLHKSILVIGILVKKRKKARSGEPYLYP